MKNTFKFKEFTIKQDKAAMKIGTDGVLLGAWTNIPNHTNSILDVGSGTGLIGLMLAQRSFAETIDAVEIDNDAYEQTVENFENSIWGDRLFCYHSGFVEFANEMSDEEEEYDLIISNPPFYEDDYKSDNESRNASRFTSSLSFEELIMGASKLLSKDGSFSLIIPFKEEKKIIEIAEKNSLFTNKICHVQGNPNSEIKRSLLEFSFTTTEIEKELLIIEKERHNYTKEYIALTKDFYLKM